MISHWEPVLFNLLVNGTFSFLAGCLVVFATVRVFRIGETRWRLYFYSLPFVKILWDLFRGIPSDSYLYHGIDPLTVLPKHTNLAIGAGLSPYGPVFDVLLSVLDRADKEFTISLADYLAEWLRHRVAVEAPAVVLLILVTTAATLLGRRLVAARKFERERRGDRARSVGLERIQLGRRTVDVYASERYAGTPFTGGLLSPFICFPKSTYQKLSEAERAAVLRHELAHVKYFDLPINLIVQCLGDVFWFVPGYRRLSRKIDRLRELLADRTAIGMGGEPAALASALVKLKAEEVTTETPVLYSALVRERSLLRRRVERLLDGPQSSERRARFGWSNRWLRPLFGAWATGGVLLCAIGGNHEVQQIPPWIDRLLRAWGLL